MNQDCIHYTGSLKITTLHKNTVIKIQEYHNSGTVYMFSFLGECLAGNYATNNKPQYIRAFKAGTEGTPIASLDIDTILSTSDNIRSNAIMYNITPVTAVVSPTPNVVTLDSTYKTTLKFTILSTQFFSTEDVNMLALYSSSTRSTDNITKPLAYFYIHGENDPDNLGSLFNNNPSEPQLESSFIIEWTITLDN